MENKKEFRRRKKLEGKPINFGEQRDLVTAGIQKSVLEYTKKKRKKE